jgi:hypothetical protein
MNFLLICEEIQARYTGFGDGGLDIGGSRVISIVDDLTFRANWPGASKMFMNGIFVGSLIRP